MSEEQGKGKLYKAAVVYVELAEEEELSEEEFAELMESAITLDGGVWDKDAEVGRMDRKGTR